MNDFAVPHDGYDADGVVLMGSSASVHDDLPWMAEISAWLRPVIDGIVPIPVLGLCFGHQLIAHLAGGLVDYTREDRSKSVGIEISLGDRIPLGFLPRLGSVVEVARHEFARPLRGQKGNLELRFVFVCAHIL